MTRNKPVIIGNVEVMPGQRASVDLPIANLYTASSLSMPVKVINGRNPGPVLFISAAIHGDELNGVEIIRRLLRRKVLQSLRGTLLAVPIVNVHGFIDQSRYLPDRRDLNRSFPGSAKGSIASRLANIFLSEIVLKSNYGIDLHTGAIDRSNLPQVRAHLDDPETARLAESFGAPVAVNAKMRDNSLRACAFEHGIPVIIYEAGEALRFDELSIRAGIRGILQVMRTLGMLPKGGRKAVGKTVTASSTSWVRSPVSGIVNASVGLGDRVKESGRLALVSDPFGEFEEEVYAPFDGIVIGCSRLPLAHEGDALFHIAAFSSIGSAADAVGEFANIHDPALRRKVEDTLLET